MNRKTHLQSHRLKAFTATLNHLEERIIKRMEFINGYSDVYQFPVSLTKRSLRKYRRWLKAAQELKDLEKKHL